MSELARRSEIVPDQQLSLFELADIANREHRLVIEAVGSMVEHATRAGDALIAAKVKVRHGDWLPWLADNFDASERTAQVYMQIASNPQISADLVEPSIQKVLKAIPGKRSSEGLDRQSIFVVGDADDWSLATWADRASSKPRLLDLFCGAGGAGMGYYGAGFEVIGVDREPQPHYPFEFIQADALEVPALFIQDYFAAVHASPPCQHYANVTRWRGDHEQHPDLIGPTRKLLEQTGLPWVIENVPSEFLRADFHLCGTTLGLPVRRHRDFETNWSGLVLAHGCQHRATDFSFDHGGKQTESTYREAMGCRWMTVDESREAVPPAYTELIGRQLLEHVRMRAVA